MIGEIASRMRCDEDAIVHRLIKLGVLGFTINNIPGRFGERWSNHEAEELRKEFSSGKSIADIAIIHGRDENAILHKLVSLRLFDITNRSLLMKYVNNTTTNTGDRMVGNKETEMDFTPFEQNVGFWNRILHSTDPVYWKKRMQTELDKRWSSFDDSIEKLEEEYELFKKHHMEISGEEKNAETIRDEWTESLKSLGNLLNKNTEHERQMWDITQKGNKTKGLKIKQKFNESDVDEIRFNNMMEYIKQYPELQTQSTINRLFDDVKQKRNEIIAASAKYHTCIKETNVYLNTVKKKLQKVEDELAAFETMKMEGEEKVNKTQEKGLSRILDIITFRTEAEKEYKRLNFDEYDRKINTSKNQLKLIKDDLNEYKERKFKPIVTMRFKEIE